MALTCTPHRITSRSMAVASKLPLLAVMLLASSALILQVRAADADPLQDFCVADINTSIITVNGFTCKPPNEVQASDFKSVLLEQAGSLDEELGVAVTLVTAALLPGLNTQGLSIARIDYQPNGLNPPHIHPRASEVLYLVNGTLKVAFFNDTLFEQILYPGDLFLFPRGHVHFQRNIDKKQPALAIAALNSQNPGRRDIYNPWPSPQQGGGGKSHCQRRQDTFGIGKQEVESLIASCIPLPLLQVN